MFHSCTQLLHFKVSYIQVPYLWYMGCLSDPKHATSLHCIHDTFSNQFICLTCDMLEKFMTHKTTPMTTFELVVS